MKSELLIGLDLGGTQIKAMLLTRDGIVRAANSVPTEADRGVDHVVERLARAAEAVCASAGALPSEVLGIGLGSPGPLCVDSGVVLRAANLPGWVNVPVRDRLAEISGLPVVLINDASAACYGEFWCGAGRGADSLALLTLGTGVGGGLVMHGELVLGHFDNASEFGHLIVHPGGRPCRCGQHGCLEAYAGGSYIVQRALEAGVFENGRAREVPELIARAVNGHAGAREIWQDCCRALAITCVNLQHAFNPEIVLLGGGISEAGAALLEPVRSAHREMVWRLADDRPRIELASLGNAAGASGAAGWFLHLHDGGRIPAR